MNNTRLQLIEGPQYGYLDIKEGTKVPLNFSVSDIRDISSRSGMYSKTVTITGNKNSNDILNNYFDVNIVAGTFDVNKRQKVAIVQNGIILRDNCFMRLLKVIKKQSVDSNIDEWVEYEVQVTDELGDFFKEVGNKEVKELDGWDKYKHTYGVDAVVDSFDHTVDDGYKYTLPWIKREDGLGYDYIMNDLMPGVYAKQIFDRIHMLNGFSYDWATMTDDDTQFDKSILPYAGDHKKLTEEYIESVKVEADNLSTQETGKYILGNGTNNGSIPSTWLVINNEEKDNSNKFNPTNSKYSNDLIVEAPNALNYIVKIDYDIVFINDYDYDISLTDGYQWFSSNLRIVDTNGSVLKHTNRLPLDVNSSIPVQNSTGIGEMIVLINQSWSPGETVVASGNQAFDIPVTSLVGTEELRVEVNANMTNSVYSKWIRTGTSDAVDMKMKIVIKSIEIEIAPDSQNGLMPGTEINIKNFLPTKMKQSEFLKTIYQKYNLYVEVDPNEPNKLVYTSRDKFYDDGEVKDWTEKLDKKREQELHFIPDITTKKMILSYKDDDKDALLDAYRGETSKTFGQVDVTFENENIKGEERKDEVFSPTINMETDFGAVLPVLNADFKMNPRILQDGGKLPCQEYSLKESNNKIVSTSFYPHLSMFDKPFNPTFSIEYGQSSFYAYNPGLFTENNLYTSHWRRTLAQINSGKMLKAWFRLTEEDIQGLKMNDKIKINNAYYYINAIIDYDANSNTPTKVELLTVEDDLKLPRVGGRLKDIGIIKGVVSGTLRPSVPSISGGFFTGAIADVIKKRYDESVVVAGPSSLTGNLGVGNTLPSGFRGVMIGDNMQPDQDGIYVGEGTQITEGGIKSNSLEVPGLTVSEDGNIDFTGTIDFSGATIPALDDKEDISNKVQDLSNPDSTTYPSTDAVKNALDTKVETVTGTGVDNTDPINPTINIDKDTIGLGNVDNIKQIPLTDKGANNGVAELDSSGKIPVSQLPSYVSDVETYSTLSSFPATGTDNIIYIAEDTNLTYRWTGSAYAEISPSIALGETSSTAYRGDRGKIAYDHSQLTSGNPHNVTKSDVGLGNVNNTSDVNKPISTATQNALNGKVDRNSSVNGLDMNNVTQTGFYYGYNMTNSAVAAISTFMVIRYSPDWIIQKQFVPRDTGNREFIRSRHSGTTWSPWKEIGSGGGNMDIVPITYSNLKSLKTNNSLTPGTRYFISDRDIWIDALNDRELSMSAKRLFSIIYDSRYTPSTLTTGGFTTHFMGIYGQTIAKGSVPNGNATTIRYVIWGGKIWRRNNSGADGTPPNNWTMGSGWTLEATGSHYESKIFNIKYNFDDDIIWEQSDDRGNVIKRLSSSNSYIDYTDWGNENIYNNASTGIFNNFANSTTKALIYENNITRAIHNNIVGVSIYANTVMTDIRDNTVGGYIHNNDISGGIISNTSSEIQDNICKSIINNNTTIIGNTNNGRIENNSNKSIIGNANNGAITSNSEDVYINYNKNNGAITNNSSHLVIQPNPLKTMYITFNSNNGYINGNISNALINITNNVNNGRIGTVTGGGTITRNASITDTVVNK